MAPESPLFAELDYQVTPLGTLVLRRRRDLATGEDIYEIKLNDEFLMSSKFTSSEEALARLALKAANGSGLSIVVGGLGLGYTAATALESPKVGEMIVVDALKPVIEWHEAGLLPLGRMLTADPRCRLVHDDFFALAAAPDKGFDPAKQGARFHAILLDIDHAPEEVLHPSNAALYSAEGLSRLARHLMPDGIFALWSNNGEDPGFTEVLAKVFGEARGEDVVFDNPIQNRQARQCVYVARKTRPGL